MKRKAFWAIGLPAILGLAACGKNAQQSVSAQAPPPTVEVAEVAPVDADIYTEYPAQTYARDLVEVRGRVEGYVEKWLFRPGQEVRAGQALYVLDTRPFQAQVEELPSEGRLKCGEGNGSQICLFPDAPEVIACPGIAGRGLEWSPRFTGRRCARHPGPRRARIARADGAGSGGET